jgi:hypothetical protein
MDSSFVEPTSDYPEPIGIQRNASMSAGSSSASSSNSNSSTNNHHHFVIYLIATDDVPVEAGHDVYLSAYLSNGTSNEYNAVQCPAELYGTPVHTLSRSNNKSIIWNTFRNFGVRPPPNSYLTVEMYDSESTKDAIGYVHIDIDKDLNDTDPKLIYFEHRKVGSRLL